MTTRRYTDQQFRDAVADPDVRTIADLCRRLGIVPRGGNYDVLRSFGMSLGVDLDTTLRDRRQLLRTPSQVGRSWTDEQLLEALADPEVDGYPALCDRLGIGRYQNTYQRLRRRARQLDSPLPASWSHAGPRSDANSSDRAQYYDPDELAEAVAAARTRREVLEALGDAVDAAAYGRLRRQLEHGGIDASHLNAYAGRARPLDEHLVAGRLVATARLRRRLIAEGVLEAHCATCRRSRWSNRPIPLELDHIDGDRFNNRLENLQLLCPNCHALTPTYRDRNIGRPGRQSSTP